jgi:glycyl-radical enzyme activating protein/glucokinase-like ROK family protein
MKKYAVGIDVGGTKIAAGVFDSSMNMLSVHITKEHAGQLPNQVVDAIEHAYLGALSEAQISTGEVAGVGLSFAGHTDGLRGVVLTSSNMPEWDGIPLRDIVSARLNKHVILDNDTNFGVVAEHRYGAARGAGDVVYITFSTGVGMGVMVSGKLYQGYGGTAGEIGHTVVEVDGRRCSCGKRGCLMAYASGIALRQRALERIQSGEETLLRELSWDNPQLINGENICEVAKQGDPVAQDLIISTGRYLGIALSTVVQVLNPEVIVLGGGLTNIGSFLLDPCLESLRQNIHPVLRGVGRIVLGRFQQNVSVIGGAAAVFSELDPAAPELPNRFAAPSLGRIEPVRRSIALSGADREKLEKVEGTVFDFQRNWIDNDSSLSTSIFFKGCPLRCAWCASPESQRVKPELLMFAAKCTSCGTCVDACTNRSRLLDKDRGMRWDRSSCTRCGECVNVCPAHATAWSGERTTAGDVLRQVLADSSFPAKHCGLTLSGGEPLLQTSFAEALLRLAKAEHLVTATETTGNVPWESIESIFPYVDRWIYELKHLDSAVHHKWTGLGSELIVSNLRKLAALGASIRVRLPLIPEVNSSDESLSAIAEFVSQLGGSIQSLDLVPIEESSRMKYEALGSAEKFYDVLPASAEALQLAADRLRSYKLNVRLPLAKPAGPVKELQRVIL